MPNESNVNLFLSQGIDLKPLVIELERLVGTKIEALGCENPAAPVFLQVMSYAEGDFPMGLGLAWRSGASVRISSVNMARQLALRFKINVATEANLEQPGLSDEWCLADHDGRSFLIKEDKRFAQSGDGLKLDRTTQRPFSA